jgi:RNA polymerase sigma-70 factor, ECF subfamily
LDTPHTAASPFDVAGRIEAARQGSGPLRGELLEACRTYLLLIANRELDAEIRAKVGPSDLVQESFVQAQQHSARFEGTSEEELREWLAKILVNRCRDARRGLVPAAKTGQGVPPALGGQCGPPVDHRTPSQGIIACEEAQRVGAALARLSEAHQQVLRLRHWEELTFEVIGQRLGRSADAARKLWYRALERLDEELERRDEFKRPPRG